MGIRRDPSTYGPGSFPNPLKLSGPDQERVFYALPEPVRRDFSDQVIRQREDERFADGYVGFKSHRKPKAKTAYKPRPLTAQDWRPGTEAIAGVPAETWLPIIAGVEPLPGGRVRCPLPDHEDNNPSATYRDTVWFCHRCGVGGGIFTAASAISGLGDRGDQFFDLRKWVAERLLGVPT